MSDRTDLENALLTIESAARRVIIAAEDEEMSLVLAAALHHQNQAIGALDELRKAIRAREKLAGARL